MFRIIILNLILLLLPTVLYVGYIHLTSTNESNTLGRILEEAPLAWLLAAGSALAVIVLLMFGTPPSGNPGDRYQPSVFKDGKIVPGRLGDEKSTPPNGQPQTP